MYIGCKNYYMTKIVTLIAVSSRRILIKRLVAGGNWSNAVEISSQYLFYFHGSFSI